MIYGIFYYGGDEDHCISNMMCVDENNNFYAFIDETKAQEYLRCFETNIRVINDLDSDYTLEIRPITIL
jgi:ferredoxin